VQRAATSACARFIFVPWLLKIGETATILYQRGQVWHAGAYVWRYGALLLPCNAASCLPALCGRALAASRGQRLRCSQAVGSCCGGGAWRERGCGEAWRTARRRARQRTAYEKFDISMMTWKIGVKRGVGNIKTLRTKINWNGDGVRGLS
jgi:hypothetical protein